VVVNAHHYTLLSIEMQVAQGAKRASISKNMRNILRAMQYFA